MDRCLNGREMKAGMAFWTKFTWMFAFIMNWLIRQIAALLWFCTNQWKFPSKFSGISVSLKIKRTNAATAAILLFHLFLFFFFLSFFGEFQFQIPLRFLPVFPSSQLLFLKYQFVCSLFSLLCCRCFFFGKLWVRIGFKKKAKKLCVMTPLNDRWDLIILLCKESRANRIEYNNASRSFQAAMMLFTSIAS